MNIPVSASHTVCTCQIVWPEDNSNEIFICSVDGTHCLIEEPRDKAKSKDPAFYSHKFHKAALNYELGVSVFKNQLVWINGPFPAAINDITIYRQYGLKDKIPPGKKLIADNGYRGEKDTIATPSIYDDVALKLFKRRARARQESFNQRIKIFQCLSTRFKHTLGKHKIVFEAVCVIVQYQIESDNPLFDV